MVSEVSAIAVASTSRRPFGERRERGALAVERQAAVQRLDHDFRRQARREAFGRPGDLRLAGQEHQRPALGLRHRAERQLRHRLLEARASARPAGPRPIEPARLDRPSASLGGQHRRPAHQRRDRRGVERGRHHQERQIRPQRTADLERQRQPEVGLQPALVELVEDQAARARQVRRGLDHPRQDALGHHLDPRAGHRLAAHAVADPPPHRLAQRLRQPLGGGARRDPARLQHDDAAGDEPGLEQEQRHPGGLAGARGRLQHGPAGGAQRLTERRQDRLDRQRRHGLGQPRRLITAVPKLVGASMRCNWATPSALRRKTTLNGNSRRSAMLFGSPSTRA